jgi:hypothetical protein
MLAQAVVRFASVKLAINDCMAIWLKTVEGIIDPEPSYVANIRKQEKYRGDAGGDQEQHFGHEQ